MYYLLEVTHGLIQFFDDRGIKPKGYLRGSPRGAVYTIIQSSDAIGINIIDPEDVYICAYGPFEPMNIQAIEEQLPMDYCAPPYEHPHRAQAMNFLLSKRFKLV